MLTKLFRRRGNEEKSKRVSGINYVCDYLFSNPIKTNAATPKRLQDGETY